MNKYKQLTLEQRYEIQTYLKEGKSKNEIANLLKVSKSTISREIERNSAGGKYHAEEAQRRYCHKKGHREPYKLTGSILLDITNGLKNDLSPEQIVGDAVLNKRDMVSHETIYALVYKEQKKQRAAEKKEEKVIAKEGKAAILCWLTCLRRKHKKRQKRKNITQNRSILEDGSLKEAKVSIEVRPDIITNKERIGDCEIDTIIGKDHKGAILTVVERVTKHTSIFKLPNKSGEAVTEALKEIAKKLPFKITSITSDNGTEFADYPNIKKVLNCDFYFAHPYSSWERGLNENTNGLIRQYILKRSDFDLYDSEYICSIELKLNNRPRKTLGFYTPMQCLEAKKDLITSCT